MKYHCYTKGAYIMQYVAFLFYLDCSTPFLIDVVFDGTSDAAAGSTETANTEASKGNVKIIDFLTLIICRYI